MRLNIYIPSLIPIFAPIQQITIKVEKGGTHIVAVSIILNNSNDIKAGFVDGKLNSD